MNANDRLDEIITRVIREDWGRLLAALTYQFGDLQLAEDVLQDAVESALAKWPAEGLPENPAGWLMTAARRRAIDFTRRVRTLGARLPLLEADARNAMAEEIDVFDDDIPDERLRLMFTCCHPALNREAQIVLTLRTLGGLTTGEIARSLLLTEPTVGQRISRAKRKIREAGIPFETPAAAELPDRLSAVLNVIYLIYNEGYVASEGADLYRVDLAAEAGRLARTLVQLMPDEPEALGLYALIMLNESRRAARVDANGMLITLEDQDRSRWDQDAIARGSKLVDRALRMRRIGVYQIQAAISAIHCQAASPSDTDWPQIVALYDLLMRINPTPIVALNRAAAVSLAEGPERGLDEIDAIEQLGELDAYYLLHAARADMLRRAGRFTEAHHAYERALALTKNESEHAFLTSRITGTSTTQARR